MISTIRLAFLTAIPVEAVNYWIVGYPASPYISNTASWYVFVAFQWYVLHMPGVYLLNWSLALREHHLRGSIVMVSSGYIDTALVIAAFIGLFRWARSVVVTPGPKDN